MPPAEIAKRTSLFSTNRVLFYLFCCYVFFAPFEDLLEYLYGVKTIFKPYRLFGILILILGFFYDFRKKKFLVFRHDFYLTCFVVYGILYTLFLYGVKPGINMGSFLNSQIQMVFLFLIFLTYKRVDLTFKQLQIILGFMSAGILINGLIIILDFYVLHLSSREKGMSDNPNYAAFGMVIASVYFVYLIIKRKFQIFNIFNLFYFACFGVLFFSILATGSRSGFLLLGGCLFIQLIALTSTQTKLRLIPLVALILIVVKFNTGVSETANSSATFNRLESATEDIRIPLAKAGIQAILDSKGMGIGISQMLDRETFSKYMGKIDRNLVIAIEKREKGLCLHNMYVEVAVETGFIGLFFLLFYLYGVTLHQWKMFKLKTEYQNMHRFLLVSIIGMLVFGLGGKGLLGALFWFVIAICSKDYLPNPTKSSPKLVTDAG